MEFFGLIHKRPGYDPIFAENPFSPADELVFMGQPARFARRLDKKARITDSLTEVGSIGMLFYLKSNFRVQRCLLYNNGECRNLFWSGINDSDTDGG